MLRANVVLLSLACALVTSLAAAKKPAPAPPPSPAPEPAGPAFDKSAAASALAGVSLLPCKQTNGPTGDGHVIVTFAPSGDVTDVNVDRDPFKNTAVGRCIAGQYKRIKVPKFAGPAVTVGKSFRLD